MRKGGRRSAAPSWLDTPGGKPVACVGVKSVKLFTVEEANEALPRLHLLIERLQRAALRLQEELGALCAETGQEPSTLTTADLLRQRPAARLLVEELDAVVYEIEDNGACLKDVQLGLVDFPSERQGEIVYLCWQSGEPEVAFWHPTDGGFAGRQALGGAARARVLQ